LTLADAARNTALIQHDCSTARSLLLRPAVNPEVQRRKSVKAPAATSQAATVGQSPDPTWKPTADLLGIGLPTRRSRRTRRSWEQRKRQPAGHLTQSPSANP
jgi:hypothetical protein